MFLEFYLSLIVLVVSRQGLHFVILFVIINLSKVDDINNLQAVNLLNNYETN